MFRYQFAYRGLFRNMSAGQLARFRGLSSSETALFPVKERELLPAEPFLSPVRKVTVGN